MADVTRCSHVKRGSAGRKSVEEAEPRGRGRDRARDDPFHRPDPAYQWIGTEGPGRGMYRPNPGRRARSPRPPPCRPPRHSGSLTSGLLRHQEEEEDEEEDAGEHPAVCCCYTTGDFTCPAADTQFSGPEPPVHSGTPSSSGLAGRGPGASSSEQPVTVINRDWEDLSLHIPAGGCWESPGMETQGCACYHGQREPAGLGPCWPGSPYVYYGLRRNLVVGVEVVEEVAVEDTLEVITEDAYTDHLLDPELLQNKRPYPKMSTV